MKEKLNENKRSWRKLGKRGKVGNEKKKSKESTKGKVKGRKEDERMRTRNGARQGKERKGKEGKGDAPTVKKRIRNEKSEEWRGNGNRQSG